MKADKEELENLVDVKAGKFHLDKCEMIHVRKNKHCNKK